MLGINGFSSENIDNNAKMKQSVIATTYTYPDGENSFWDDILALGKDKVPYVLINPDNGAGKKIEMNFVTQIKKNKEAGIKNIAYISTNYQKRNIEKVKDEVDRYLEFYGKDNINGFFFDEIARTYHGIFLDYRKRDCMKNVITINPDGTIAGCLLTSVLGLTFTSIDELPDHMYQNKKYSCSRTAEAIGKMKCYECDIFKYCNGDCYQLSWVNGRCATPKKLYKKILHDVEIGKYEM